MHTRLHALLPRTSRGKGLYRATPARHTAPRARHYAPTRLVLHAAGSIGTPFDVDAYAYTCRPRLHHCARTAQPPHPAAPLTARARRTAALLLRRRAPRCRIEARIYDALPHTRATRTRHRYRSTVPFAHTATLRRTRYLLTICDCLWKLVDAFILLRQRRRLARCWRAVYRAIHRLVAFCAAVTSYGDFLLLTVVWRILVCRYSARSAHFRRATRGTAPHGRFCTARTAACTRDTCSAAACLHTAALRRTRSTSHIYAAARHRRARL